MTVLGTVADWMTHEPVSVAEAMPVDQVLRLMRAREIRHVLVMQGDRLAGIFSNRDVRRMLDGAEPRVAPDVPVAALLTEKALLAWAERTG
ncbi:MAG: CBS domain-containing protein [Candidatus Rokubacteria bacterium]|nr:CBS domain-containing protein [Candidatus Rokubacteria bacterium]